MPTLLEFALRKCQGRMNLDLYIINYLEKGGKNGQHRSYPTGYILFRIEVNLRFELDRIFM